MTHRIVVRFLGFFCYRKTKNLRLINPDCFAKAVVSVIAIIKNQQSWLKFVLVFKSEANRIEMIEIYDSSQYEE